MTDLMIATKRSARLQAIVSSNTNASTTTLFDVRTAFIETFPMGLHLYNKLIKMGDVSNWISSLDVENERIFFTSREFDFLN